MEQISLEKRKQKKLKKKVDRIKKKIITGGIKIKDSNKPTRKPRKNTNQRGAIYIGHIPHGFYEDELMSYFSQFGHVTRVKLARSKRTGKSKGYGFVEFYHCDVAKIAAETMNNYLMFNCILKCRYIPPEEQHRGMFVRTITPMNYPRMRNRKKYADTINSIKTKKEEKLKRAKTEKKIEEFKKFFQERGIEFNFKVNDPEMSDERENGRSDSESDASNESESEDLTDDQYGVLEIDESDDEIQFETPPQVKKVIIRHKRPSRAVKRVKYESQKTFSSRYTK